MRSTLVPPVYANVWVCGWRPPSWTTGTTKASGPPRTFMRSSTPNGGRAKRGLDAAETGTRPNRNGRRRLKPATAVVRLILDRPGLVVLQLFGELCLRQRPAEVLPLPAGAPDAEQEVCLFGGFDSLPHGTEAARTNELQDCREEGGLRGVAAEC